MKFDVNEIMVVDLNGDVQPVELGKALGNTIYSFGRSLDWLDVSKAIHRGQAVELSCDDLAALKQLIAQPYVTLLLMVKDAIINYIDKLLTNKENGTTNDC